MGACQIDRNQIDWKAKMKINLIRCDLENGHAADYSSNNRMPWLLEYEIGPGSPGSRPDELALRGVAISGGRLYLANGFGDEIMEFDPATGTVERSFPLPTWWRWPPLAKQSSGCATNLARRCN